MSKKIILSEQQYLNLKRFILETKFDTFIKNNAKAGDILVINFKNTERRFKIISNDMGQIQMDPLDSGAEKNYRYFITYTSLSDDKLVFKRAHKINDKDKLSDVSSWENRTLTNVTSIDLMRNGQIIDSVDKPTKKKEEPINTKPNDFETNISNNLAIILEQVKEGNAIKLNMVDGEEIMLCCMSRQDNTFTLELVLETKITSLKAWDSFILTISGNQDDEDLFSQNQKIVKTKDKGKTFSLLVTANSGKESKKIWINGISGVSAMPNCSSKEEPKDEKKPIEEPAEEPIDSMDDSLSDEQKKAEAKKAMQMILADPLLKKAFYRQPSLWDLFVAEIKGVEATGKGISTILNLVDKYEGKKIKTNLDGEFKEGKTVNFKPVETTIAKYEKDGKAYEFEFDSSSNVSYNPKVMKRNLGESYRLRGKLNATYLGYEIEVLNKLEENNFKCKLTMIVTKESKSTRFPHNGPFIISINEKSDGFIPNEKN